MRTTLHFDQDVALLLKSQIKKKDMTLRQLVNQLVRLGFKEFMKEEKAIPKSPEPIEMEAHAGINYENTWSIIEETEGI